MVQVVTPLPDLGAISRETVTPSTPNALQMSVLSIIDATGMSCA